MEQKLLCDYFTEKDQPIKCEHCNTADFIIWPPNNSVITHGKFYVICQKCSNYVSTYTLNEKQEKIFDPYYVRCFLKANPQNWLLNSTRAAIKKQEQQEPTYENSAAILQRKWKTHKVPVL